MPGAVPLTAIFLCVAGCATQPTPEPDLRASTRELRYSGVVLEFVAPSDGSQGVALTGAGGGFAEGAKMMAVAPVECLRAGPFVGAFCIGLAPLFPFMSAAMVQDEEISLREVDALYRHVSAIGVHQQFFAEVRQQLVAVNLQLTEQPVATTLILRVWVGPISLLHDGYKGGYIALSFPYRFTLLDAGANELSVFSGESSDEFDVDEWYDEGEPDKTLAQRREQIVAEALRVLLLEWQPELVLGPRQPRPVNKRSIIGIMQERWPVVDSVRPVLGWQSLEEVLDADLLAEVTDISYEVRIGGRYSGKTFYSVAGLPEPQHQLTTDLEPCASYIWQPRARFRFREQIYSTSLRQKQWSKDVRLPHPYTLDTPGSDCGQRFYP